MKKENKKLAQQRRAKQRKVQKVKNILEKVCKIGIPSLIFLIGVGLIVLDPFKNLGTTTSTPESNLVILRDPIFEVKDGDTVNIDFVGYVDGKEFEGGNTQGQGTNLTIGSKYFIDDFEEQLIGAHVQDVVDVTVTFPEDYGNATLNGKEALFKVTINGIYVKEDDVPESELVKDETLEIKKGNTVNIDFVGRVDGEEFEGGNTKGEGTELVIGSKMYIDDFEEQLIGKHPGETVEVTVQFPDDYDDAEVKGKEAVFTVTINGIYQYKIETESGTETGAETSN